MAERSGRVLRCDGPGTNGETRSKESGIGLVTDTSKRTGEKRSRDVMFAKGERKAKAMALALAMGKNNQRQRRGPTRFGISKEGRREGGGWPGIIFISLAQRRTGTIGTGSGEREKALPARRQGHWARMAGSRWRAHPAFFGPPFPCRPRTLHRRLLPGQHRAGTAKSHGNGARLGTPPAATRVARHECLVRNVSSWPCC
jgi:hypothetical protein